MFPISKCYAGSYIALKDLDKKYWYKTNSFFAISRISYDYF
jgi:hypothetical protein